MGRHERRGHDGAIREPDRDWWLPELPAAGESVNEGRQRGNPGREVWLVHPTVCVSTEEGVTVVESDCSSHTLSLEAPGANRSANDRRLDSSP